MDDFLKREESYYYIHLRTTIKLASTEFDMHSFSSDECPDPFVDILSTSPFLAAIYNRSTHGLISCTQSTTMKFKCCHCSSHPPCDHIALLQDWCDRNDLSGTVFPQAFPSAQTLETFKSISYHKIPYPLSNHLKEIHDALESGKEQFPVHFIPALTSGTCTHGNK